MLAQSSPKCGPGTSTESINNKTSVFMRRKSLLLQTESSSKYVNQLLSLVLPIESQQNGGTNSALNIDTGPGLSVSRHQSSTTTVR